MAAHARLKNEFTEDEKYHDLMIWLKCFDQKKGANDVMSYVLRQCDKDLCAKRELSEPRHDKTN